MTLLQGLVRQWIAHQTVSPEQGTVKSTLGAVERLSEPDFLDIVSPFFAFTVVIIFPTLVALWVIFKTLTAQPTPESETTTDEQPPISPINS